MHISPVSSGGARAQLAAVAALALATIAALALFAWYSPARAEADPSSVWQDIEVTLGAGALVAPEYEGADSYEPGFLPVIEASWRDTVFVGTDGAWVAYPVTEWMRLGPLVSYDAGRDEDDSSDLRGLGDVDPAATLGAILQLDLGPVALEATFARAVSSHEGWLGTLSLGRDIPLSSRLNLNLAAETSFADDDYMDAFFGISPQQASRSGLRSFDAGGGLKSVGVTAQMDYALSDNWSVFGATSYARLLVDAADSPLVEQRGSANQLSAALGLAYTF